MDVSLKNEVIRFAHAREFKKRNEEEKAKEKEEKVKREEKEKEEKEKKKKPSDPNAKEELLSVTYDDLIVVVWDDGESNFVIQNKKHDFCDTSSVTDCEGNSEIFKFSEASFFF